MTTPHAPNLPQRAGFAIGLQIGRALRAIRFQRKPLQIIPKVGPWLMRYGYEAPVCCTGVMVTSGSNEITVSGARKGHPGLIIGLRWRHPRPSDREFMWQWSREHQGTAQP